MKVGDSFSRYLNELSPVLQMLFGLNGSGSFEDSYKGWFWVRDGFRRYFNVLGLIYHTDLVWLKSPEFLRYVYDLTTLLYIYLFTYVYYK